MDECESLSHSEWECKYHAVFRVRSELMRSSELSRRLPQVLLPACRPLPVGPSDSQRDHGLGVVRPPPGAGALEALLNHVAVSAFDLARADGQALREGALVVQMSESVAQIAMASTPGGASASGTVGGSSAVPNAANTRVLWLLFKRFFCSSNHVLGLSGAQPLAASAR